MRKISLFGFVFAFCIVLLGADGVRSQENQPGTGGSGLSISPTRFFLTPQAGSTDTVRISVKNVTSATITANPVINDFTSDNDTGTPQIVVDENRDDLPSIKPFFGELESFEIEPDQTVTKEFTVEIPSDTPAGGYYGLLRFLATPEGVVGPDDGQVALTASLGSVILIEVPGDITEQVQVQSILFYRKDVAGTFFSSQPEQIGVQIRNQGNGFIQPFGKVSVKNPFGKEILQYELNNITPRGNILPSSTRTFRENLSGVSLPGRYVATADVSFGNGSQVLTIKESFWYLPYWFLGILFVIVLLLVVAGFAIRRKVITGSFKRRK